MPSRILVTGASGTVGRALVQQLKDRSGDQPVELIAATRSALHRSRFEALGMGSVHLDYSDRKSLLSALTGIERVFLCTGYTVEMLVQSKAFIDVAKETGVQQIVHLGALEASQASLAHFVWHDLVETYIEAKGFAFTHLRPRAFMQNVLSSMRPGSLSIPHYSGNASIGWIDADDIARAAAVALLDPSSHSGHRYDLCEDSMTMEEVAAVLSSVTGLAFVARCRPIEQFLPALIRAGMEPVYAASLAAGTAATARGEATAGAQLRDGMRRATGKPGTSWTEFAGRHREFIVSRATAKPVL
jgi:NAD(P)H dehydrogenase (quinone)